MSTNAFDGTEALARLRTQKPSTREVVVDSHEAGAVDFMVKPFERSRLLAGISRHLPGAVIIDGAPEPAVDVAAGPCRVDRATPRV